MTERAELLKVFLQNTRWQDCTSTALPADASARRYHRLHNATESVILMDAPPESGEDVKPFIEIATYLETIGISAPGILKADQDSGYLLLEDLGFDDIIKSLDTNPSCETLLYQAATDVLVHLRNQKPPSLKSMTPSVGGGMVRIVGEHYVQSNHLSDDLSGAISEALERHCGPPDILALRDFHAENLIWRPSKSGISRMGVLDFQDAFLAPDGYDLASLVRDARRDVSSECTAQTLRYFAKATSQSFSDVERAVSVLSVQRNLRILGVFGRLIRTKGKTKYINFLPRVWSHILADAQHPVLTRLHGIISKGIPEPTHPSIVTWTK